MSANNYIELSGSSAGSAGAGVAWSGSLSLIQPEPWMQDAACAEVDPDTFFPPKGGDGAADAKRVCRGCDVRHECLIFALEHDEGMGIWGGTSPRERSAIKKRQRAAEVAS